VTAAVAAGLPVTVAPGPSAVLAALALSGLPTDRFAFEGFPPRKPGERARALAALADERRTLVFFEAPHRLASFLAALATAFGEGRRAAVCRELTKTYEEVRRDTLSGLVAWAEGGEVRGEIVVVVGGAPERPSSADAEDLVARVLARADAGERLKDAVAAVADESGAAKRDLYQAALAARAR
jgi:16S rRNA (cytidine1402-2'-O)-methyltransferase